MKRHVVIAIPAYSSTAYLATFRSLLNDVTTLLQRGDTVSLIDNCGSAYIDDTRALILAEFLKTEGTDLVAIDHDLVWEPGALVRILDAPVDMCGAVYRKRDDKVEYPVRYVDDNNAELWADPKTGLLEVAGIGFGLVKCSRAMLERMVSEYETLNVQMPNGEVVCALYEPIRHNNIRLHEDFAFCHRWRAIGGKVWVDPEILTAHIGVKPFVGHWGAHLRENAGLTWDYCLHQIQAGRSAKALFMELIKAWGNGTWACSSKMQEFICDLARNADGPILEFGSGLSTVVMAAATDKEITSFEVDDAWAQKVLDKLPRQVNLVRKPLVDEFYDDSDLPDEHFALAVCDGPYTYRPEVRGKALPIIERVLKAGGSLVVDDLQVPGSLEQFKQWAEGKCEYRIFKCEERTFAVGRKA